MTVISSDQRQPRDPQLHFREFEHDLPSPSNQNRWSESSPRPIQVGFQAPLPITHSAGNADDPGYLFDSCSPRHVPTPAFCTVRYTKLALKLTALFTTAEFTNPPQNYFARPGSKLNKGSTA